MIKNRTVSVPMIGKFMMGFLFFISVFMLSIVLGAADTSLKDAFSAITFGSTSEAVTMIREIRLPREIAAVVVGSALAVSGAIMQGMTRNPLADPGLLGITAGGNFALAVTLAFLPSANYFTVMLACFAGTALGTLLVFGIGMVAKNGFTPVKLVLAGSAISALLYALAEGISLYFRISKNVSMWTSGGLIGTTWSQLRLVIPFILIGLIVSLILSRQLTILSVNEEVAAGLGQNTKSIKIILLLLIIILAGASVALVGSMAFIGLMIPHIVRFIVGTDYRFVLPMSALCGATFMLLADTVGRTIYAPYETPVAAIVAMLGLPFFLLIVQKGGKGY
ncbi:iron ABC transporter permease [Paenibacillus polygoni]|uniref:Iron ABC transporter permease n=1 Tax=Paenibacillus polygoni TaxID=3050112 RepID=A0ABY8X1U0_9BACL|nr:iron ABC transporter permease [Paenibacillus polygoni]WIV19472.1 iron ABC transporter permease [Paenibacillus polygoni]